MANTFSYMAIFLFSVILLTAGAGTFYAVLPESPFRQEIFILHFFLGLSASIAILFVHCIVFIYFLGTGRWVKEVALAYQIPDEPFPKRTRELKRLAFPAALFSMLIGIATAAAGAGAQLQAWPWYIHATLAVLTLGINLWAFSVEHQTVSENAGIIQAVMGEVDRIRKEKGLNTNDEALLEAQAKSVGKDV